MRTHASDYAVGAVLEQVPYHGRHVSSPSVVRSVHIAIVLRLLRILHPWLVRAAVEGNLGVNPGPGAGPLGTLRRLSM